MLTASPLLLCCRAPACGALAWPIWFRRASQKSFAEVQATLPPKTDDDDDD
jgi:hypothetical protein